MPTQSNLLKRTLFVPQLVGAALAASVVLSPNAQSQVTRFEILNTAPAYEGRSFGTVGAYVKITARATLSLDPLDRRNAVIADIALAPRDANGRVTATADVVILKPANASRSNGTLLVDVPNRGRKLAPQVFDDVTQPGANNAERAQDAGIGYVQRHGYTYAWIGWQVDLPSQPAQLAMQGPPLAGITGPSRDEFVFDHMRSPATVTLQYPIADPASLAVSVRQKWEEPRQTPSGLTIKATGERTAEITRPATGFDAGAWYEVTFTAKDPQLLGLGFAATRDVVSFLKRDDSAQNPVAKTIRQSIGFGVSQSGRFLRDFLYFGFNEDMSGPHAGSAVFEGLMPHIAGGRRMSTNYRFALINKNSRHAQDPAWQADLFPFTYATLQDPVSGRRDGLMQRCRQSNTCPKVMQTDSEHEWWASRASLVVTDTQGNHLDLPSDVRIYMVAGTPHYGEVTDIMKSAPTMALPVNPMHAGAPMRALLKGLNDWITVGAEPPASRAPMRAHGTLVKADQAVAKGNPALPYTGIHVGASHIDATVFPPRVLADYPVFVPLADNDGMSIAGIRMLPLLVPKASYTGWNPRATGFNPNYLFPLQGAVVPFAATREERLSKGDTRLSIAERYADSTAYVAKVREAAAQQVAERLMLPEDAERVVEAARGDTLARLK